MSASRLPLRLRLESLEGRETPAVVHVVNTPTDVVDSADQFLSLREAVIDANVNGGSIDVGGLTCVLDPAKGNLPALIKPVTITHGTIHGDVNLTTGLELDAGGVVGGITIQSFGGNGLIVKSGVTVTDCFIGTDATGMVAAGNGLNGIVIQGSKNVVRNTVVGASGLAGITVSGSGNKFIGNKIGVGADGTTIIANTDSGLIIQDGSKNTIGGKLATERNIISGNGTNGIALFSELGSNKVLGNYIGVDGTGALPRPNSSNGIEVTNGTKSIIGGSRPGERNIISGNLGHGIYFSRSDGNKVLGNFIGTDATGVNAIANGADGVRIENSRANIVGGANGARNISSGNTLVGVRIRDFNPAIHEFGPTVIPANGNKVIGNFIGLNVNAAPLGNGDAGVSVEDNSGGNFIGGTKASNRNFIAANVGYGVQVISGSADRIQGNFIGLNPAEAMQANQKGGVLVSGFVSDILIGGKASARNLISGNTGFGVTIDGATGTLVQSNNIGTDRTGTIAKPNSGGGILVQGSTNATSIGGLASVRNVIAGNGGPGIVVKGSANDGTSISGNYIGADATGLVALANTGPGIQIQETPTSVVIGKNVNVKETLGNLISGNTGDGINIDGLTGLVVSVVSNLVGVDKTGTKPLANGDDGIDVIAADGTIKIFGQNIISANKAAGVHLEGPAAAHVYGNSIGTDKAGRRNLGNGTAGVYIQGTSGQLVERENLIAFNTTDGVLVDGATASGNAIFSNRIYSNGNKGIALLNGANSLMPTPVIQTVTKAGTKITITGSVVGRPLATLRLELFANKVADPLGGEGTVLLGVLGGIPTDANGAFTATFTAKVPGGYDLLSITATDLAGNTSEFALCKTI